MCGDLALNTAHKLQVMHMQLFEMENEEPVCGGRWRRLCGCGRGGHHVVSGEEGDCVHVWKGRDLCREW